MPYCHTHFHVVPPEQVEDALSSFTKENFVGGQSAYLLDDGSFNVDAGENDLRAYFDENEATIKFFCRDERDVEFYDKKLTAFAAKHGIARNKPSAAN